MKISIAICTLLLFLPAPSFSQDHAPTVEQCRADQRLWSSVVHDKDAVSKLSAQTLTKRSEEIQDCFAVDPENSNDYFYLMVGYGVALSVRYKDFIQRHNLTAQFLAEDAAGKR
jgi:hypothetical protein